MHRFRQALHRGPQLDSKCIRPAQLSRSWPCTSRVGTPVVLRLIRLTYGAKWCVRAAAGPWLTKANIFIFFEIAHHTVHKLGQIVCASLSLLGDETVGELKGSFFTTPGTSWAAFEKMEERVVSMEAQAETAMAMVAPDGLEQKFM